MNLFHKVNLWSFLNIRQERLYARLAMRYYVGQYPFVFIRIVAYLTEVSYLWLSYCYLN